MDLILIFIIEILNPCFFFLTKTLVFVGSNHCFKTRLGPAGRTVNRWVGRFEPTFGLVMQLTRPEPVKIGKNR